MHILTLDIFIVEKQWTIVWIDIPESHVWLDFLDTDRCKVLIHKACFMINYQKAYIGFSINQSVNFADKPTD